jgi:hypothetical protein
MGVLRIMRWSVRQEFWSVVVRDGRYGLWVIRIGVVIAGEMLRM